MSDLQDAKLDAQKALFEAITSAVADAKKTTIGSQSTLLVQLSLAYRYAAGGSQPGGGTDNAK